MQNLDFLKQKKHPNKDVKLIFILQHLSQMELSGSQWIPKKKHVLDDHHGCVCDNSQVGSWIKFGLTKHGEIHIKKKSMGGFEQYEIKSNDPPVVKCGKLILCIM